MKNKSSIFSPFSTRFPQAAEDMRGILVLLGIVRHFAMARTTVSELIEARRTLFAHQEEYGQVLRTLYAAYFDVKALTLYDFQRRRDVSDGLNLYHD